MACGVNFLSFPPRECHVRNREKTVALHRGHPAKQLLSIRPALTGTANCMMWISVSGQRTARHGTRSVLRFKLPGEIVRPGAAWRRPPGQVQVPPWLAEGGRIRRCETLSERGGLPGRTRVRGRFRVAHAPAHADSCQFPVLRTKQ